MKHIYTGLLLCLCFFSNAQITITGTVTDAVSATPLPFVNITSNTGLGTTTNDDGTYSIVVSSNADTLTFSYLGFKSQTILVSDQTLINIALQEDSAALDEVVITALGLERDTKELGYAVQAISSKSLNEVKTINFLDNLQGKLAGVTVTQGATGVGSSSKITIRGEASFSNNNPLFVVDGVPINNETVISIKK